MRRLDLQLDLRLAEGYKSPSQRTRRITEGWFAENMYCAACPKDCLERLSPIGAEMKPQAGFRALRSNFPLKCLAFPKEAAVYVANEPSLRWVGVFK